MYNRRFNNEQILNNSKDTTFLMMSDKEHEDTMNLWKQMNQLTDVIIDHSFYN